MLKKVFTRPHVPRVKPDIVSLARLQLLILSNLNFILGLFLLLATATIPFIEWLNHRPVNWLWVIGMTIIALNILSGDYVFPFRDTSRGTLLGYLGPWAFGTALICLSLFL